MTNAATPDLSTRLREAGQGHLVDHAATLAPAEAARFLDAAAAQPWATLRAALAADGGRGTPPLRPPQSYALSRQLQQPEECRRVRSLGQGLLAGGRVATLLLAGGQGTRLGHDGPKGLVAFGPDEGRTLYRIHAERVAAASERYGHPVPLFVLVSATTEAATRAAFEQHGATWGLAADQARFLMQGTLPAMDSEGRALLAGPGRLALSPDGHGGAFDALASAGVLDELAERGIDVLTTYQVDNPLGRSLDPLMLGWMVERRLEAIGKAVRRTTPDEKVGLFARDLKGRMRVVEYSELPTEAPADAPAGAAPDSAQESALVLGSIAIHGFSVRFLRDLAAAGTRLPLHIAHKRVPHLGPDGTIATPEEPNGVKLERFLFDLFPQAARAEVQEVKREWEFAPVKNASGADSLVTARVLVDAEIRRWMDERGLPVPDTTPPLEPRRMDGPAS